MTNFIGLCAIITARGGTNSIPAFLMDSVFLSDMHMATMAHRRPSYPLLDAHRSSLETSLPQICSSYGLTPYRCESLIINNRLLTRLNEALSTSLEQLQDIVNYINSFGKSLATVPGELRNLYLSKTFAVEHGILSQIQPHQEGLTHETRRFYIIATLLFIYTSIQKWKSHSPLVRIVVRQLQGSLTSTNEEALLGLDSNLLLWSLFIGAYASPGQITRRWFVMEISKVTAHLLLTDWADIHACLMACYYVDSLFDASFEEIWFEAEGTWHSPQDSS